MRSSREREARETLRRLRALRRDDREGRWRAILAGLTATYRWCRQAMAAAHETGADADHHGWRQAVAYHTLQVRELAVLWPGELGGRLEVLERLSELQRQDRDLYLHHGVRPETRVLIDQRHQALRALARPLGRRLHGEPPATFRRCLQACWQTWRTRKDQTKDHTTMSHPKRPAISAAG
jgi:hypothetical protein